MMASAKLGFIVLTAALAYGCGNLGGGIDGTGVIPESNRNTNGVYDGQWLVQVGSTLVNQRYGSTTFRCPDKAGDKLGSIIVAAGEMSYTYNGTNYTTPVSSRGLFKLELPAKIATTSSSGTSSSGGAGPIILRGSFEKESGNLTFLLSANSNTGCTSIVDISRLQAIE